MPLRSRPLVVSVLLVASLVHAENNPEIQKLIAAQKDSLQTCFRHAGKPTPEGTWTLNVTLQEDGSVATAKVKKEAVKNGVFKRCLETALVDWQFPRPYAPAGKLGKATVDLTFKHDTGLVVPKVGPNVMPSLTPREKGGDGQLQPGGALPSAEPTP